MYDTSEDSSMSILTAGIVHEVKNPLQIMRSSVDILRSQVPSSFMNTLAVIDQMESAINRAHKVLTEYMEIARPGALPPRAEKIDEIIENSLTFLKTEFAEDHATYRTHLNAATGILRLNKRSVQLALIQLFRYAVKSIRTRTPKRLTVTSRTTNVLFERGGEKFSEVDRSYGEAAVLVEVICSTPDIDDEIMMRLFEHLPSVRGAQEERQVEMIEDIVQINGGKAYIQNIAGSCILARLVFTELYSEVLAAAS